MVTWARSPCPEVLPLSPFSRAMTSCSNLPSFLCLSYPLGEVYDSRYSMLYVFHCYLLNAMKIRANISWCSLEAIFHGRPPCTTSRQTFTSLVMICTQHQNAYIQGMSVHSLHRNALVQLQLQRVVSMSSDKLRLCLKSFQLTASHYLSQNAQYAYRIQRARKNTPGSQYRRQVSTRTSPAM